ncbi:unnamed protein product [Adineta steineri]|uniref:Uncharacterized protein n=1 Tax=Adineta steineri TaxID=433720 RepID=A0A813WXS1_9BILA|nr:unnamed protein product [Adineta steineri]CAF1274038.1 unnamed protein product [Adineta steineri]
MKNDSIVWLDTSSIFGIEMIQKYIIDLRHIYHIVEIFNDSDACVDYMTNAKENRIFFIVNEFDGQFIVPIMHDFEQLDSIFVLRSDRSNDEEWSGQYNKVKGIYNNITLIRKHLYEIQHGKNDSIGFEITSSSVSSLQIDGNKKNRQEVMFMYGQLVKEILTQLPYSTADVNHMIEFCLTRYSEDPLMIEKIIEFERDYRPQLAVQWYTKNIFPFQMVNEALRVNDLSTLYAMRVFIKDVHKQIVEISTNLRETSLSTLYRGQRMLIEEFERIKNNPGGLLSISSFWSTSVDENVAQFFTGNFDNMVAVIFVIHIDSSVRTTTFFANIEKESQLNDNEKEYLFTMGSIFRIELIEKADANDYWTVNLSLTSDNDPQLTLLTTSIRSAVKRDNESHICGLAILMMHMDEHELAAQILEEVVKRETDPLERMKMHWTLGVLYTKLKKSQQALTNYDKVVKSPALRFLSIEIISYLYHGLGELCIQLKMIDLALINMEIALSIEVLSVPNHSDEQLARYCRDIASIYEIKGYLHDALPFYRIAFEKAIKCYPSQHPLITRYALDLARIASLQGEEKYAESILSQYVPNIENSLPPNHPMQVRFHIYTGYTLLERGDFSSAHAHFQSALTIDRMHKEANYPGHFTIYWAIGTAFGAEGRLDETFDAFSTALRIQMATLPAEDPSMAITYTAIGRVFETLDNISEALLNYECAMDIYLKHMPSTDPAIIQTQQHISRLYEKLDQYHLP